MWVRNRHLDWEKKNFRINRSESIHRFNANVISPLDRRDRRLTKVIYGDYYESKKSRLIVKHDASECTRLRSKIQKKKIQGKYRNVFSTQRLWYTDSIVIFSRVHLISRNNREKKKKKFVFARTIPEPTPKTCAWYLEKLRNWPRSL